LRPMNHPSSHGHNKTAIRTIEAAAPHPILSIIGVLRQK
jgi:hypothetical protein